MPVPFDGFWALCGGNQRQHFFPPQSELLLYRHSACGRVRLRKSTDIDNAREGEECLFCRQALKRARRAKEG